MSAPAQKLLPSLLNFSCTHLYYYYNMHKFTLLHQKLMLSTYYSLILIDMLPNKANTSPFNAILCTLVQTHTRHSSIGEPALLSEAPLGAPKHEFGVHGFVRETSGSGFGELASPPLHS
jgi:hypothetical protein